MEPPDRRLSSLASAQFGVFTTMQAARCGLSRRVVERRLEQGLLVRLYPGVYGFAAAPATWRREVIAAVLSIDGAVASHRTAAELWDMTTKRGRHIEVVVNRWDRVRRPPFVVHESKDLLELDVVTLDGIPATTAQRTVVDLGASAPRWLVEACLDAGLRKGLFTIADVHGFLARVARRGRRGVGVIRPILEERTRWDGVTESELEDRFRQVVARAGLRMPVSQYVLRDDDGGFICRADFAYPGRRLLIELDSEAFHMNRKAFRADRKKQNEALSLGWRTLRFTWHDLVDQPAAVVHVLADI